MELTSLMSPALTRGFFTTSATWEAQRGVECTWETGINIYTLLCVKQITNKNPLPSTGDDSVPRGDLNGKEI